MKRQELLKLVNINDMELSIILTKKFGLDGALKEIPENIVQELQKIKNKTTVSATTSTSGENKTQINQDNPENAQVELAQLNAQNLAISRQLEEGIQDNFIQNGFSKGAIAAQNETAAFLSGYTQQMAVNLGKIQSISQESIAKLLSRRISQSNVNLSQTQAWDLIRDCASSPQPNLLPALGLNSEKGIK